MTGRERDVLVIESGDQTVASCLEPDDRIRVRTATPQELPNIDGRESVDCVVLGAGGGIEPERMLERIESRTADCPVIVSGVACECAGDLLDAGATDILCKCNGDKPALLTRRVHTLVDATRTSEPGEKRLERLLENSPDRLSVLAEDGTYQYIAPAVKQLMGHTAAELEGTNVFEYVHPDDREHVRDTFEAVCSEPGRKESMEYRIRDSTGNWRWVHSTWTNRFGDPIVAGVVINSREITERVEREQHLRKERERFEVLFEQLEQPVVEAEGDDEPTVVAVNAAFEEMFGFDADEIVGEPLGDFLGADTDSELYESEHLLEGDNPAGTQQVTRETADGTREFLLQTARYEDDSRGFGIYADITDRVEQRQLLEGYETVLEAVDELVYILDENGRFQFVNKAQESMTGYSRDELLGEHISVLMDEASRQKAREYIDQLQTTDEQSVRFERTATTADGTEIHCEDRMALLPGDSDFQGTAGIIRDITEHKEREQKLQAERERFRVLFERLPEPTLEFKFDDGAPVVKDANPAFEETFGYEAGEIVGESFDEYIVPAGRTEEATTLNQRVREGKQFHSREITRQTADGTREFLFRPAVYSDGDEAFAVYADITEQKDRERQLREEQALTETLINTLPVVFFAFDEQGQFMRWNDRANEISGFSDEEIASMHPAEFVVEEDRPTVYQKMSEIIEHDTTVSFEAKAQNKDGDPIPHEYTAAKITDDSGETMGIVGVGRDISDRKERQRRFEAVFNNTYQFTGLMDPDGTLIEINNTALQFGGLDREDVVGERLWDVYWFQDNRQGQEVVRKAVETAQNGSLYRGEVEVQGKERSEVIDFSVRPIVDEQGKVKLLIPEGRTITELKEREQHLKVMNRFLRHNVRNQMTIIQGQGDYLASQIDDSEYQSCLEQITENATELTELTETAHELLQLTVEQSPERRPVAPGDVVKESLQQLGDQYPEAAISVDCRADALASADNRLGAVVEELVENAIVHGSDKPQVDVTVSKTDDHVEIHVADDGPGIPDDELAGIMTDQEQTQLTHGTGFGLWIVRSIVDDCGGELDYRKRDGSGSKVIVRLQQAGGEQSSEFDQSDRR